MTMHNDVTQRLEKYLVDIVADDPPSKEEVVSIVHTAMVEIRRLRDMIRKLGTPGIRQTSTQMSDMLYKCEVLSQMWDSRHNEPPPIGYDDDEHQGTK